MKGCDAVFCQLTRRNGLRLWRRNQADSYITEIHPLDDMMPQTVALFGAEVVAESRSRTGDRSPIIAEPSSARDNSALCARRRGVIVIHPIDRNLLIPDAE